MCVLEPVAVAHRGGAVKRLDIVSVNFSCSGKQTKHTVRNWYGKYLLRDSRPFLSKRDIKALRDETCSIVTGNESPRGGLGHFLKCLRGIVDKA